MSEMLMEDYIREQINKGQYGVIVIPISTAEDIAYYIETSRDKTESVRHGKWIKENIVLTSLPPQSRWHCSECGSIKDGYDESVLTPYCPKCGAKMLPPTQTDNGVR